jgi:hypothetical protein
VKLIDEHQVHERQRLHALQGLSAGNLHLQMRTETPVLGHQHAVVDTGPVQVLGELLDQHAALAHEHDPSALLQHTLDHVLHDPALTGPGGRGQHLAHMPRAEAITQALHAFGLVFTKFQGLHGGLLTVTIKGR